MTINTLLDRRLCIAPMMGCTDRHCRVLFRLLSPGVMLYSEMVTTGALIHGDARHFLKHSAMDAPCALQLGGSNPDDLAECAKMVEAAGYQEVNLNIGCPSDRVQTGGIGACLMASPDLVAECVYRMQQAVEIPVTVKCRIGIDENDSYEFFSGFVNRVADAGCQVFIVHARKAILKGLSPKENRQIPPLMYDYIYKIKQDMPDLVFILNGGIRHPEQIDEALEKTDGIMVGREAYRNPYFVCELTSQILGTQAGQPDRFVILDLYKDYLAAELATGESLQHGARHLLGLFHGMPGARQFRRYLSEHIYDPNAGIDTITTAARALSQTDFTVQD
jgi:tRNA-dihydrouridine synthase A